MMASGLTSNRRDVLRGAVVLAAAANLARGARAAAAPLGILDPEQVATIEALGEVLLPGAAAAGLVHFIDAQLQKPPEQALLTLRYLDVRPPYAAFYGGVCAALDAASRFSHAAAFAALEDSKRLAMVKVIARENPPGWDGPAAPLAYFVIRSDALDVVYATVHGYRLLDIPYLPHILPEQPW